MHIAFVNLFVTSLMVVKCVQVIRFSENRELERLAPGCVHLVPSLDLIQCAAKPETKEVTNVELTKNETVHLIRPLATYDRESFFIYFNT